MAFPAERTPAHSPALHGWLLNKRVVQPHFLRSARNAGGGNLYATNLTVNATVKAAIRSDRGGGTLVVDGGTYTTSGSSGAPAIYSTADITVSNATLIANDSEAVVVEGLNSVTLIDSDVTGNMSGTYGDESGENIQNVMLYQSMSGDAQEGTSVFTMTGGSLVSNNGDMFYITNTDSVINLSGVDLTLTGDSYITAFDGSIDQVELNGYTLYMDGTAIAE